VQTNFGGVLQIDGAPVGVELGKYYLIDALKKDTARRRSADLNDAADGSIIIVIATDAPVDARNLRRMADAFDDGLGAYRRRRHQRQRRLRDCIYRGARIANQNLKFK
jgi:D-aminopeptidase